MGRQQLLFSFKNGGSESNLTDTANCMDGYKGREADVKLSLNG